MRSAQPSPNLRMPGSCLARLCPDVCALLDIEHWNPRRDAQLRAVARLRQATAENRKGNCHEA